MTAHGEFSSRKAIRTRIYPSPYVRAAYGMIRPGALLGMWDPVHGTLGDLAIVARVSGGRIVLLSADRGFEDEDMIDTENYYLEMRSMGPLDPYPVLIIAARSWP